MARPDVEGLAARLRPLVSGEPGVAEKAMFGGIAFLVGGNMAVSASANGGLMLRCEPGDTARLVAEPGVERVVMRGRAMDGWLRVEADQVADEAALRRWAAVGLAYARSLPAKSSD